MTAHAVHHARSGRFVRAYLLTWGLLAACALTYLGSLAWQPELLSPTRPPRSQIAEADAGLRAATQALAEVGTVQRTVGEIQKDLGQLKEAVGQHEAQDKSLQSRVTALEERTTTPEVPVAAAPPAAKSKVAEKGRKTATEKAHAKTAEPQQPTRVIATVEGPNVPANSGAAIQIETGSIIASRPPTAFGDTVVTTSTSPAPATGPSQFAVQLAAGPSLDALRLSWGLLVERHGAALASLQPRFVAPRNAGGPYRLVAGPLPSKAEADKVCTEMAVGPKGCIPISYIGEPL